MMCCTNNLINFNFKLKNKKNVKILFNFEKEWCTFDKEKMTFEN